LRPRPGSFAFFVCLLVLAVGTAHAAEPKQAVFRVTLTANLTKEWTFTRVEEEEDRNCTRTTRGTGRWQAKLAARRPSRLRVTAVGVGKVRFSRAVGALAGTAVQSGRMTVTGGGDPLCDRRSRSVRCAAQRRSFTGASSVVRNPRKGVVQLGSLRGAGAARAFPSECLEGAADIRAIRTDLPLARAPLETSDVFGRNIPRFFTSGEAEQVTTLEGEVEGRVTERVRWTLVFTRLSR
jgi:hypothetical protein